MSLIEKLIPKSGYAQKKEIQFERTPFFLQKQHTHMLRQRIPKLINMHPIWEIHDGTIQCLKNKRNH